MCNAPLTTAISERHQFWFSNALSRKEGNYLCRICATLSTVRRKERTEEGRGADNHVPRLQARSKPEWGNRQ